MADPVSETFMLGDPDEAIRELLRKVEGPEAQLVVGPSAIDNMHRVANALCVTIRVSRDVPVGAIYALTPEEAEKVRADYVVEPSE